MHSVLWPSYGKCSEGIDYQGYFKQSQVNSNKYPLLKKKRSIIKHQNCMLLHCMYNKRKVIAILGVQVLNSEVMSVKNMKYKAVQ